MSARLPGSHGRRWASAPTSMATLLGRAERDARSRCDDQRNEGPPQVGDSSAQAVRGVPQGDARVAPAVLVTSVLPLGAEKCAWTVGLGPSAPSSSAGGVSCARAFSGPGPATAGYPGPGLCACISRDAGPPGPGALDPDVCTRALGGAGPSGTGEMTGGRSQTAQSRIPGDSREKREERRQEPRPSMPSSQSEQPRTSIASSQSEPFGAYANCTLPV